MKIILEEAGKRFNRQWIFRNLSLQLSAPGSLAVLGPNGSGKSTLLRILSGYLSPSEGKIRFLYNGAEMDKDLIYTRFGFCAPYIELIEELTVIEMIRFHSGFKKTLIAGGPDGILERTGLKSSASKTVKELSSGMKQRLKLALVLMFESSLILLDEPATNLDEEGMEWYKNLLNEFGKNRLVVVASNRLEEHYFIEEKLNLDDFRR